MFRRGSTSTWLAALWLAVFTTTPVSARAQNADWNSTGQEAHLRAVRAERGELLREALAQARPGEEQLARLRAAWRTPGTSAGTFPSLGAMMDAVRELRGDAPGPLQRLADSLDLQPVAGAFSASAERGPVLRVRVYPLYPIDAAGDFHLSLYWVAPDGTETRARRESVAESALAQPGFEMFVRAPASEPGLWHLIPEVERDGSSARGVPVPVPCLEGPLEVPETPTLHQEEQWLRIEWQLLLERGLRSARGVDAAKRDLDVFARGELDLSPLWDGAGEFPSGWMTSAPDARRVLLLVCPTQEAPGAVFRASDPWGQVLRRPDSVGISTIVRVGGEPSLESVVERTRAVYPELPIVLVVRGDGAARLSVEYLARPAPAVEAVVVGGSPVDLERHWGDGPWLVVGNGADAWSTDGDLPGRVADWLEDQGL